jgi:membrane-associated protease RseP (regulator of RpoE activity)
MKNGLIAVVVSAVWALAIAGWYFSTRNDDPLALQGTANANSAPDLSLDNRVVLLEQAVADERQARQLLQDEVFYLTSRIELLSGVPAGASSADETVDDGSRESSRDAARRRNSRAGRIERLVAAGFLPGQADWITQREQQLQMDALQARFDAERSGEPVDWMANRNLASDTLRAELGDADYERYLDANDQSTSIAVSSVIESSPAQTAGLQPGDLIVRYDGARVFSMTDLTRQTMVGEPGQNVAVDVMRDGVLIQVVMPRGPVGITGGRRRY